MNDLVKIGFAENRKEVASQGKMFCSMVKHYRKDTFVPKSISPVIFSQSYEKLFLSFFFSGAANESKIRGDRLLTGYHEISDPHLYENITRVTPPTHMAKT